jgi:hypothetical protein
MERCGDRAQGRSRIIAPLDPNERRRSFYRDDIDRCREIQPAGTRENAVNYVPFGSGRHGTSIRRTLAEKRMAPQKLSKSSRDCWSRNVERTPRSFWEITAPQEGAKISPPAIHASSCQQKTITPNDALCLGSLRAGEGSN